MQQQVAVMQQAAPQQEQQQGAHMDALLAQEDRRWQDAEPAAAAQMPNGLHSDGDPATARRTSVTMADADADVDADQAADQAGAGHSAAGQQQLQDPLTNGHGAAHSRAAAAQESEAAGNMRRSRRGDVSTCLQAKS